MRVGLISSFPPSMDGLAVYTYKLCKAMIDVDKDVKILVAANVDKSSVDIDGVEVVKAIDSNSFLYPFKLLRAFIRQKPDVIHCQYEFWLYGRGVYSLAGIILLLLLKVLRRKIVTTLHGIASPASFDPDFLDRHSVGKHLTLLKMVYYIFLMKSLIALSSVVIVHLKVMKDMLVREFGCDENKVIVIWHGADHNEDLTMDKLRAREQLGLRKEGALLLCFGEVRRGKGLEYAIAAMAEVRKRFPDATLLIAGGYFPELSPESTGLLDNLRDKVARFNLNENVVIKAGFIPEQEVALIFIASDTTILAYTDFEVVRASGPLFRAMSYGVPVIVSDVEMFRDVVKDGESAALVRSADVRELAEKIIFLISNPNLRVKIGSNLRRMSVTYAWEKIADRTLALYRTISLWKLEGPFPSHLRREVAVSRELRILYVTPSYSPYVGGVEYVVEELAKGMAKMRCEVSVLTLALHPSLLGTDYENGVTIKRIFGVAPFQAYYLPSPSLIASLLLTPCDIIHIHAVHSLMAPASILAAFLRTKIGRTRRFVVLTPHYHDSGFSWHTRLAWLFYRPIVRIIMRSADIVHSISSFEANLIKSRCVINPILLEHGVSEDVLRYDWNPPKVLTVTYAGVLQKYKRVDILIRAMKHVNEVVPEVKLLIIGNGPDKGRLMKLAEDSKVNATFLGYLPRNEYLKRLACSSMVVNLSSSEAFGVTVLEALAMGVPSITVRPWGTTFERYTMSKVLPSNPTTEQVSEAILSLTSFRHRGKPHVLTWSDVCDRLYKDVYAPLLGKI